MVAKRLNYYLYYIVVKASVGFLKYQLSVYYIGVIRAVLSPLILLVLLKVRILGIIYFYLSSYWLEELYMILRRIQYYQITNNFLLLLDFYKQIYMLL